METERRRERGRRQQEEGGCSRGKKVGWVQVYRKRRWEEQDSSSLHMHETPVACQLLTLLQESNITITSSWCRLPRRITLLSVPISDELPLAPCSAARGPAPRQQLPTSPVETRSDRGNQSHRKVRFLEKTWALIKAWCRVNRASDTDGGSGCAWVSYRGVIKHSHVQSFPLQCNIL